jgi:dihydrofolate synthase / folylpolyglutamate synthase
MDYREAIGWIVDRSGYERGFVANPFIGDEVAALGLRRTTGLLEGTGTPDRSCRVVHVAGTKGKGSTCATIAAIAGAAGLTTGMYATPHLHTFRERIQIDGEPISEEEFAAVAERVAVADQQVRAGQPEIGEPTAFEVTTAMALLAFERAGVDMAVVEVGMGGRLDATNVVEPAVCAITSISYDHMAILGDTLTKIAFEKGGIIKPGVPVAVGPQGVEALAELRRIASERDAPLFLAGRAWQAEPDAGGVTLNGPWGAWKDIALALRGDHQVENAGLALMAAWLLDATLLSDEKLARRALASVRWPGRYEQIASSPDVIVDGAHNVDSIARLAETLETQSRGGLVAILGIGRDKDVEGMLSAMAHLRPRVIATSSHNPRAADPQRIAVVAREAGLPVETATSIEEGLRRARTLAGPGDTIVVTGSLYAVAEAREALGLAATPSFERSLLYG